MTGGIGLWFGCGVTSAAATGSLALELARNARADAAKG